MTADTPSDELMVVFGTFASLAGGFLVYLVLKWIFGPDDH